MKFFILALTLVSSLSAFAKENCDDYTATNAVYQCIHRNLAESDKLLNVQYNQLMKKLDKVGQAKLKASQRAWIAFRDAECFNQADEMRGGTYEKVIQFGCHNSMTEERNETLKDSLELR